MPGKQHVDGINKSKMNRLILIGNGFDLAHGRKTSYNDFIVGYLKKAMRNAEESGFHNDELLDIKLRDDFNKSPYYNNVDELVEFCSSNRRLHQLWSGDTKGVYYDKNVNFFTEFTFRDKCPFFKHLVFTCSRCNWVDIEKEYYNKLVALFKETQSEKAINSLHISMTAIIREIDEYIKELPESIMLNEYNELFLEDFTTFDMQQFILNTNVSSFSERTKLRPDNTMILNFNYTDTLLGYEKIKKIPDHKFEIVNIHGSASSDINPIVFGFGDEADENYNLLEKSNIKGLFTYTKSFWYFKTQNYHKLLNFIHAEPFQVYILGHSCGLTDRTMLKMIFEHDLCASIKIFYHNIEGNNNYTDLTYSIARHFSDKVKMRARVVPFDSCSPMPQRN